MKIINNVYYGKVQDDARRLDLYLPDAESFPVYVHFHGGGLEKGDRKNRAAFIEYLISKGFAVVSADYRKYPNAHYPEFIEDAAAAVAWAKANIGSYGKCERIFVGGSSAGGYLSMMLCFDRTYLGKYGILPCDIDGFIHNAGQPTAHFNILKERGIDKRRVIIDDTAPLYHIGCDEKYPPMLFIVSDNDMTNRYEQTMLTVSTLKHFGHEDNIRLRIMHGRHCEHDKKTDENGNNLLGQAVLDFLDDPLFLQIGE